MQRMVVAPGVVVEVAAPALAEAPAVVVVHEWWGLTDDIRGVCAQLAACGFTAAAVDLYRGETTADAARAEALADALDTADAMRDLQAVVSHLGDGGRPVAIAGFSLGGAMALAAAGHVAGLAAAVPFYGLPLARWIDPARVAIPVQGHYAARDVFFPPDKVRAVFETLAAGGVDVELHVYDAGHAFVQRSAPSYDEVVAAMAWNRTIAFLRRHLEAAS